MRVLGLLSGTSADGISVVICDIFHDNLTNRFHIKQIHFKVVPFSKDERELIFRLFSFQTPISVQEVCKANFILGHAFARAALEVIQEAHLRPEDIDIIGSHGQTVWHDVDPTTKKVTSTLQLGEPAVITELTGITCVADFRVADVAAGGQGAPLTSIFDWLILRPTVAELNGRWRAVQNIGGIANVTLLPPHGLNVQPIAFDTGPGNVFIDWCATQISEGRQTFDENGRFASQGHINTELLQLMESHMYFQLPPPKTTGRELFTFSLIEHWAKIAKEKKISDYDFIATVTELTASSIVNAYKRFSPGPIGQVVVGGGGCRNPYLMERIKVRLQETFGHTVDICTHEKLNVNSDAKEGLVFALLAYLCIHGMVGNLPSCTGARGERILGKIVPGKNFGNVLLKQQQQPTNN